MCQFDILSHSKESMMNETSNLKAKQKTDFDLHAEGFDIPKNEHADDVSSISDSDISEYNNNITIDTDTIDSQKKSFNIKAQTKGNVSLISEFEASDEEDRYIDEFLSLDKSIEEATLDAEKKYGSYDKESKEVRGRPSACIFVASLSSDLSDDILCESVTQHFKQWGELTLVKVLRDPSNRPYAFVQYAKDEDADRAINEGQHSILNGRTVRCEKARVNRTLYLQLNGTGIREKIMRKILSRFGDVERLIAVNESFDVINTVNENENIRFKNWFSKFVYRQDAISAFANLKTKINWNVEWAQNLEDEYSNIPEVTIDKNSVFVGHLDPRISKEELIERFERHGKIKEAILVNRPLNNFAFIKFRTKEAAASAVERENHAMFKYKTIHVQYREMYNNYRRKCSNDNGLKLNLAPPPVNFKKRYVNENRHGNCYRHHRNYRMRNSFSVENCMMGTPQQVNNIPLIPETFAQALKLKQMYNIRNSKRKIFQGERPEDKYINSQCLASSFNSHSNFHPIHVKEHDECQIRSSREQKIKSRNSEMKDDTENSFTEDSIELQLHPNKKEPHTESEVDEDASAIRTSSTFSSRGPKTEYTFSTVDNAEHHEYNIFPKIMGPQNFQYPMYYSFPEKEGLSFVNHSMQYLTPNDQYFPPPNPSQPPHSPHILHHQGSSSAGSAGYYYPYPYYLPPSTPSSQMQPMYPLYYYYNPIAMTEGRHNIPHREDGRAPEK